MQRGSFALAVQKEGFTQMPLISASASISYLSRNLTFNNANRNNLKFSLNARETN